MNLIHNRHSTRLPHYDYGQVGAYFATINVNGRECALGEVVGEEIQLSDAGEIVQSVWGELPVHYRNVELDEFIVMPNHVHGIIWITEDNDTQVRAGHAVHKTTDVRAQHAAPLPKQNYPHVKPGSLGAIVRSFKSAATRKINQLRHTTGSSFWQRGYYEHVIRDDEDLFEHRKYIQDNPLKWSLDEYYQEMETAII